MNRQKRTVKSSSSTSLERIYEAPATPGLEAPLTPGAVPLTPRAPTPTSPAPPADVIPSQEPPEVKKAAAAVVTEFSENASLDPALATLDAVTKAQSAAGLAEAMISHAVTQFVDPTPVEQDQARANAGLDGADGPSGRIGSGLTDTDSTNLLSLSRFTCHSEISSMSSQMDTYLVRRLTTEENHMLQELMQVYDLSFTVDLEPLIHIKHLHPSFNQLVNQSSITVLRLIKFAKRLEEFVRLTQECQIGILKGTWIHILLVRSVSLYDSDRDVWVTPRGDIPTEILKNATGFVQLHDDHVSYCKSIKMIIRDDLMIVVILLVIVLFSPEGPYVINREVVSNIQDKYLVLLKHYLESKYTYIRAAEMYPQLMSKLKELKELAEIHGKYLLDVNPSEIEPIMLEILDLK